MLRLREICQFFTAAKNCPGRLRYNLARLKYCGGVVRISRSKFIIKDIL